MSGVKIVGCENEVVHVLVTPDTTIELHAPPDGGDWKKPF
jgi:hypothetical protein